MIRISLGAAAFLLGLSGAATITQADYGARTQGQDAHSPYMRSFGRSLPPIGHVGFCNEYPSECQRVGRSRRQVKLTLKRKAELRDVNNLVNQMVRPVSDMSLYGRVEYWTYPNGEGDCEDYVLLKQRLLIERGWPAGSLLITVLRDEYNEGHAVLTVRTSRGDFLLDNKRPEIMTWNETQYSFVKWQSARDPKVWVSLTLPGRKAQKPTTGTGAN
jgi:predicted transglutaminase-like cysteine proteinase